MAGVPYSSQPDTARREVMPRAPLITFPVLVLFLASRWTFLSGVAAPNAEADARD